MSATITIRIAEDQRKILKEKARLNGQSTSVFIREILERELSDVPLGQKVGHLRGILSFATPPKDSFRRAIRERNWRR